MADKPLYERRTFTRELAEALVAEHGTAKAAAEVISPFTRNRLGTGTVAPGTIVDWFASVLAPSPHAVKESERRREAAEKAGLESDHPILEDAVRAEPSLVERKNRLWKLIVEDSHLPDDAIGAIEKVNVKSWGVHAKVKDADGNDTIETKALYSTSVVLSPKWEKGPEWPLIQPGKLAPIKWVPPAKVAQGDFAKRVFIIPDIQIGYYRNIVTMKLEPFHDLVAVDAMLQMLRDFRPTHVVILGDFLDCASLSRYLQVPEFQLTLQPSIYYGTALLQKVREIAGKDCVIDWIEGNHERRLAEHAVTNAKAAYGLRRGFDTPEDWPVLSIPNLLCLKELNIGYSTPYPSGQLYITPKLVVQHQDPKKTDLRASVIHGHQERLRVETRTIQYHDRVETYETWCLPGLGRIDDVKDKHQLQRTSVPSDRTRKDANQAVGVVYVTKSGQFRVEPIRIDKGFAIFQGREYQGRAQEAKRLREVA